MQGRRWEKERMRVRKESRDPKVTNDQEFFYSTIKERKERERDGVSHENLFNSFIGSLAPLS